MTSLLLAKRFAGLPFAALVGVSWSTLVSPEAILDSPKLTDEVKTRTILDAPRSADGMASLILHETAHQVFDVGTLDFFGTVHYYWYSLFEHHSGHPDEAMPHAVSNQFANFTAQ